MYQNLLFKLLIIAFATTRKFIMDRVITGEKVVVFSERWDFEISWMKTINIYKIHHLSTQETWLRKLR